VITPTRRTRRRYRIAMLLHERELKWADIARRIGITPSGLQTLRWRCRRWEEANEPIREGYELTRDKAALERRAS